MHIKHDLVNEFLLFWVLLLLHLMFSSVVYAQSDLLSGDWRTAKTSQKVPASIIRIYHAGRSYQASIIQTFAADNQIDRLPCHSCRGRFHNQSLLGLPLIWDLVPGKDERHWVRGRILDPTSGNIYRAECRVSADGKELKVRGYLGISLFGRTVTWYRAN